MKLFIGIFAGAQAAAGQRAEWQLRVLRKSLQELQQPDRAQEEPHGREAVQVRALPVLLRSEQQVDQAHEDPRAGCRQGGSQVPLLCYAIQSTYNSGEAHEEMWILAESAVEARNFK